MGQKTDEKLKRFINNAIILIGIPTIGAALYLAAIDRILIASVVCFAGAVPATILALFYPKNVAKPEPAERLGSLKRSGLAIFWAGVPLILLGTIAAVLSLGALPALLLSTGPGILLGGGYVFLYARSELKRVREDEDLSR